MHLKRKAMPRSWPVPKTGTKYVVKARPGRKEDFSLPLLILVRNILKMAKTKNEVQKILNGNEIIVNSKIAKDVKAPLGLFDTISIPKIGKSYKMVFSKNGKFDIEETKEPDTKICKVTGKTALKGKKYQINCFDGRNILSNEKIKVNDSVLFSFKDKKIIKVIPLKEKAHAYIIIGKHKGEKGTIEKIEGNSITVGIDKKPVNIQIENIFVVG